MPALLNASQNSLEYSFDRANIPAERLGRNQGSCSRSADHYAGRSEGHRRPGRDELDASRSETGSRALERLGHRTAVAGGSEGRRVRVQESDRGGARICGRLAQRGARADSGRRDRRRQAVHREGARHQSEARPHLLLQGHDPEGRWRLRWRAGFASHGRNRCIRAIAWR